MSTRPCPTRWLPSSSAERRSPGCRRSEVGRRSGYDVGRGGRSATVSKPPRHVGRACRDHGSQIGRAPLDAPMVLVVAQGRFSKKSGPALWTTPVTVGGRWCNTGMGNTTATTRPRCRTRRPGCWPRPGTGAGPPMSRRPSCSNWPIEWAVMHPVDSIHEPATYGSAGVRRRPTWLWPDPGAPTVAEYAVAEFAAAIGLSTEAGKRYLGEALELRYRLPRLWQRVIGGDLPAGRPGWSPGETTRLSPGGGRRMWTGTSPRSRTRSSRSSWTG